MPEAELSTVRPAHSTATAHSRPARLPALAPLAWLAAGWDDFRSTGYRAAFYGLVFAAMGWAIGFVYETQWQLTMGLTAGFLLLGPFVCAGIYELSRQRERGEPRRRNHRSRRGARRRRTAEGRAGHRQHPQEFRRAVGHQHR